MLNTIQSTISLSLEYFMFTFHQETLPELCTSSANFLLGFAINSTDDVDGDGRVEMFKRLFVDNFITGVSAFSANCRRLVLCNKFTAFSL